MRTDFRSGLLQVSSALHHYFGLPCAYAEDVTAAGWLAANQFRCVVVMLVDAMGSRIMDRHLQDEDFLMRFRAASVMSVFPPTTTAATTSLLTGKSPAENGWVGWNQYFPQEDDGIVLFLEKSLRSGKRYPGIAQRYVPVKWIMEKLCEAGIRAESVWPAFGKTNPCRSFEEICSTVGRLAEEPDVRMIYAYWDAFDDLMHGLGPEDPRVGQELRRISNEAEKLAQNLPADTGLLILADHGMESVICTDLSRDRELCSLLRRPPSLEPRACSFAVRKGMEERFEKLFRSRFGDAFELLTREEVLAAEVFGPGTPHPLLPAFTGDYLAIAQTPLTLLYDSPAYRGHHAGTSEAEVMIPLVLYPQSGKPVYNENHE